MQNYTVSIYSTGDDARWWEVELLIENPFTRVITVGDTEDQAIEALSDSLRWIFDRLPEDPEEIAQLGAAIARAKGGPFNF